MDTGTGQCITSRDLWLKPIFYNCLRSHQSSAFKKALEQIIMDSSQER